MKLRNCVLHDKQILLSLLEKAAQNIRTAINITSKMFNPHHSAALSIRVLLPLHHFPLGCCFQCSTSHQTNDDKRIYNTNNYSLLGLLQCDQHSARECCYEKFTASIFYSIYIF
jgi:hypothetical protein